MWRELDWLLLVLVFALVAFGLVTLYGSTANMARHAKYAILQMEWVCVGAVGLFILLFIENGVLKKAIPYFYALAVLLLFVVLETRSIKGASSWFRFHGVSFQPSEPAKIAVVLMLARILARYTPLRGANLVKGLAAAGAIFAIPLALVAMQPDLGTAAVFLVVFAAMLYCARIQRGVFFAGIAAGILGAVLLFPLLKPYQQERLTNFLDPESDPKGAGYQIIQARVAQGSGRIWGKGFCKGTQSGLEYLPDFQTDFIFSTLGEQFGAVGSLAAIALFSAFVARSYYLSLKAGDRVGAYAIVGLTSIVVAHVLLNVGMSLGLLPVTGLPLPFFSYGGSFMLTNFLIVGLILNLRMRRYTFLK